MSNREYYTQPVSPPVNQPFYNYRQEPDLRQNTSYSSAPPSYTSQPIGREQSPFEAPFDDHVYPAAPFARPQDSQQSFASTVYAQGGGGRPQDLTNEFRDDIPLRNTSSKRLDTLTNDHVYDAAEAGFMPSNKDDHKPRRGFGFFKKGKGRIPWVVYCLTIIQVSVFIAELVKCAQLTGSPIELKPSFNPMIGPSPYVTINMGARYVACMHNIDGIQNSNVTIDWHCPNSTTNDASDPSNQCTLSELCGFNGVPNPVADGSLSDKPEPNQWFRFILPIFLHAGIIHIGFNMLLQVTMGREMEKAIGPIRFFLVYMCSGIFGFVLGGNYAGTGIASTGASGALFGIIALTLLDLLYTWRIRPRPWMDLMFILLDVIISFVLGLLPGLDNFSHVGGFFMGLVLGTCILRSPQSLRKRTNADTPPYTPVGQARASDADDPNAGFTGFLRSPIAFFKGRKGAWWAWWLIRAAALAGALAVFIVLLKNFYVYRHTCNWCQHLCINVNNWCSEMNLKVEQTSTSSKRSVF